MYIYLYISSMPRTYSVADARVNLPRILDEVETGMDIRLTRRGHPVAVVMSSQRYEALAGAHARFDTAYRDFLERHSAGDLDLDAEFFDGLRDARPARRVRL
jgi:prevent-host-death family protein